MKIRVYYEDTDCGGIVYHSNYINFCERARSELFFAKGKSPHDGDEFFVVKRIEADYIKSAKFSDILDIETKVVNKRNSSLTLEQNIYRDEQLLFKALITVVFVIKGKPKRIPQSYLDILL